jgi:exopolyphosphatase/pppGpp-phosphohydrolase
MEKGREDIIPQGIVLLQEIMQYFRAEELMIDANGVRHGILCERLAFLHNNV